MIILGIFGASANAMLLVGNMVSQSCAQTGEVCQCYKTAYLVDAAPRAQFNAQVKNRVTIGMFRDECVCLQVVYPLIFFCFFNTHVSLSSHVLCETSVATICLAVLSILV